MPYGESVVVVVVGCWWWWGWGGDGGVSVNELKFGGVGSTLLGSCL